MKRIFVIVATLCFLVSICVALFHKDFQHLSSTQMIGIGIVVMVMPTFMRLIKEPSARIRKYTFLFQALICLLGVGYLLKSAHTLGLRLDLLAFGAIWIIFFGAMAKTIPPAELLALRDQPKDRKAMSGKGWKGEFSVLFRRKTRRQSKDITAPAEAQSKWECFVADVVIPTFQEIKSSLEEGNDGTTVTIERAPVGEHWVRLTWSVAPSPSLIASLPPSSEWKPASASVVLTYRVTADVPSGDTRVWSESSKPNRTGHGPDHTGLFREQLGNYHRGDLTKDAINTNFLAHYRRLVLLERHSR